MNASRVSKVFSIEQAEFLKTAPESGLHLQHVATAFSPEDLSLVNDADVNLVVLPRTLTPELFESAERFGALLDHIHPAGPDGLALDLSKFDFDSGRLAEALRKAFTSAMERSAPKSEPKSTLEPDVSLFALDVAELTEAFARIAREPGVSAAGRRLRLRIDRVDGDMCAAFHTDCYRMRLICTYRGAGTQWTANDNVNRREFYSLPAAERLLDPQRVFQLRAGWAAILKGEDFPGAEGAAIVHRSPSAVPGEWRLILRIDCD